SLRICDVIETISMSQPLHIVVFAIYAMFAWIIGVRLLRGDIKTRGLLQTTPEGPIAPERVQLLAISLFAMASYAYQTLQQFEISEASGALPAPPAWLIAALAGSNVYYLAIKAFGFIKRRF